MSENNYGALMMKSSLSAAIDIDTIVLPGIYPIPSNNNSSPDPNGGVLIVHSGTVKQRTFTSSSIISACSYYDDTTSKWSEWLISVVQSELAASDGLKLVGGFGFVNPQMFGGLREGANKQVISSQADSLIKISRIWADFFPANTSNQPI